MCTLLFNDQHYRDGEVRMNKQLNTKHRNSPKGIQFKVADSECVCFNLRKAARVVTRIYDDAFRPTGLKSTQMPLLVAAAEMGPATVNSLAEAVVMDRTSLTRNLKFMKKIGLLKVQVGNDQRERLIMITEKGRALVVRVYPLWNKVQSRIKRSMGEKSVNQLLKDLTIVLQSVKT